MLRNCIIAGLVLAAIPVAAQTKRPAVEELAVDVVVVKRSPQLRGAVVSEVPKGPVLIAVRRDWLRQHAPKEFEQQRERETAARKPGLEQLIRRINAWLTERQDPVDELLQKRLQADLERIQQQLENLGADPPSEFVLLTVPRQNIRRITRQTAERRTLALLAWQEKLDNPEDRRSTDLQNELQAKEIDPETAPVPDLSDRIAWSPDNDSQWAARQAVIEYEFRKRLDFQGTGGLLIDTTDKQQLPDAGALFQELFGSALNQQLSELLGGPPPKQPTPEDALKQAVNRAEVDSIRGFRVTRVAQDLNRKQVAVESQFLAKMPSGQWKTIWLYRETADASKPRPELTNRIKNDERVKQILQLAGAAGQAQLDLALGFGAATMELQENMQEHFAGFRSTYDSHVDGPVLLPFEPEKPE